MWLKRTNIQLICSLIEQKRTDKKTNMQNIYFKKLKRPVDEQIFGIRRMKWVYMWLKKNKYSDFGFKLQAIEELIYRMCVRAAYDKRTNM